jgi:hypothetical protein
MTHHHLAAGKALTVELDIDDRLAGVVDHRRVGQDDALDRVWQEDLRCCHQSRSELVDAPRDLDQRFDSPRHGVHLRGHGNQPEVVFRHNHRIGARADIQNQSTDPVTHAAGVPRRQGHAGPHRPFPNNPHEGASWRDLLTRRHYDFRHPADEWGPDLQSSDIFPAHSAGFGRRERVLPRLEPGFDSRGFGACLLDLALAHRLPVKQSLEPRGACGRNLALRLELAN